jgi:hypothetical protein
LSSTRVLAGRAHVGLTLQTFYMSPNFRRISRNFRLVTRHLSLVTVGRLLHLTDVSWLAYDAPRVVLRPNSSERTGFH